MLVLAVYVTFFPPDPAFGSAPGEPYSWAPVIDTVWFILGVVALFVLRSRGHEEWLLNAGEAIAEA